MNDEEEADEHATDTRIVMAVPGSKLVPKTHFHRRYIRSITEYGCAGWESRDARAAIGIFGETATPVRALLTTASIVTGNVVRVITHQL